MGKFLPNQESKVVCGISSNTCGVERISVPYIFVILLKDISQFSKTHNFAGDVFNKKKKENA